MNWDQIQQALEPYTTENIIAKLVEWDLLHNPYFIGGVIVLALICHFLKQRLLTAFIIIGAGIATLASYTFGMQTVVGEIDGPKLILFVATGVAVIGAVIYLLFIRHD